MAFSSIFRASFDGSLQPGERRKARLAAKLVTALAVVGGIGAVLGALHLSSDILTEMTSAEQRRVLAGKVPSEKPCEEQAWPFIAGHCLARAEIAKPAERTTPAPRLASQEARPAAPGKKAQPQQVAETASPPAPAPAASAPAAPAAPKSVAGIVGSAAAVTTGSAAAGATGLASATATAAAERSPNAAQAPQLASSTSAPAVTPAPVATPAPAAQPQASPAPQRFTSRPVVHPRRVQREERREARRHERRRDFREAGNEARSARAEWRDEDDSRLTRRWNDYSYASPYEYNYASPYDRPRRTIVIQRDPWDGQMIYSAR